MIIYQKVSKTYPGNAPALNDVSIQIRKGEFVSVVGQSGAGKSTFLKMLYAEERPTDGYIPGVAKMSLAHKVAARLGVTREELETLVASKTKSNPEV